MKAIILVGGQGTRLRPLTCNIPKAIVPLLNKPYLVHLMLYLKKHGVDEVVLAMGYNPKPIQETLASYSLDMKIHYVVENAPLGTAGAVKNAEKFLDDTFFVFNGDVLTEIDLSEMTRQHNMVKPRVSIALTPVDNPTIYGIVETDPHNIVKRFVEKPSWNQATTNMINAGIYILEPELFNIMPESTYYMFESHFFPEILRQGKKILGYKSESYWIDIGTPEKYLRANLNLLRSIPDYGVSLEGQSNIHGKSKIIGPVLIGKDCNIEEGVIIKGPAVLGPSCTIENNSIIQGSILWEGVRVSRYSTLTNCIICRKSCIGANNILDNCVIGDGITIKPSSGLQPYSVIWPEGCIEK